jgi:transposase
MAHNFLTCDREQVPLLPSDLRDWLAEDHLAWFVLDALDEVELSVFFGECREDGWGRAAFDPGMMVALLVYAYAIGGRSSRAMERRCREDIAFRVITGNQTPDHATIVRFQVRHPGRSRGLVHPGFAFVRAGGDGVGRGDRGRWHQAARERVDVR